MEIEKNILFCVLGPTASGKTTFAVEIAKEFDGEIISADSRQVYQNMDIGTGKDLGDYQSGELKIPYHLIDIVAPGTEYNVYQYQMDFVNAFNSILSRNKLPVLCGGSGMYIEAVLNRYELIRVPINEKLRKELEDKDLAELARILLNYRSLHNTTDIKIKKRLLRAIEIEEYYSRNEKAKREYPEFSAFITGILYDRETRRKRITERLKFRLENGMIEEAQDLLNKGVSHEKLIFYGLEYKYLSWYLTGKITYNEMFTGLNTSIHQFAKRQMTWYRKMERNGFEINWIDGELSMEEKIARAKTLFQEFQLKVKGK